MAGNCVCGRQGQGKVCQWGPQVQKCISFHRVFIGTLWSFPQNHTKADWRKVEAKHGKQGSWTKRG